MDMQTIAKLMDVAAARHPELQAIANDAQNAIVELMRRAEYAEREELTVISSQLSSLQGMILGIYPRVAAMCAIADSKGG